MNLKTILENQAWDDDFYADMIDKENALVQSPTADGEDLNTNKH